MAKFPSWSTVERDPLVLPIPDRDGVEHDYEIPPLGYLDELRIKQAQRVARETAAGTDDSAARSADVDEATGLTDEEFYRILLGDALEKMRADNVPAVAITHAAAVAHADATAGREVALYTWLKGLDPKALADDLEAVQAQLTGTPANRVGRRAAAKTARKQPAKKTTRSRR